MSSGFKRIAPALILLVFLASGCGFYHEKDPGDPNSVVTASVTWPVVYSQVFQPRCDLCHSAGGAGFNSSNYQNAVTNLSKIQDRAITRQSMPPDSPLTPYETAVLQAWISNGTPP